MHKKIDKIAVIGMGYVGLPLAIEFGKKYSVIAFDINRQRISELLKGFDKTLEVKKSEIKSAKGVEFTFNEKKLNQSKSYLYKISSWFIEFSSYAPISKYPSYSI